VLIVASAALVLTVAVVSALLSYQNLQRLSLPDQVLGMPSYGRQLDADKAWVKKAREATDGGTVTGRSYRVQGHTLRLVAARGDLTGDLDLKFVTGATTGHDDVKCTQTLRFSTNLPATVRPTMMLCWRVSPGLSVYALDVNQNGPKEDELVGLINRLWSDLG
jgi:hypothetical protein